MEGPKFLGWSSFHQILKKKVIAPIWSTFFRGLGSFQKKKAIILKLLQFDIYVVQTVNVVQ